MSPPWQDWQPDRSITGSIRYAGILKFLGPDNKILDEKTTKTDNVRIHYLHKYWYTVCTDVAVNMWAANKVSWRGESFWHGRHLLQKNSNQDRKNEIPTLNSYRLVALIPLIKDVPPHFKYLLRNTELNKFKLLNRNSSIYNLKYIFNTSFKKISWRRFVGPFILTELEVENWIVSQRRTPTCWKWRNVYLHSISTVNLRFWQ